MNIPDYIQDRKENTTSKNTIFIVQSALDYFEKFVGDVDYTIKEIQKAQDSNPLHMMPYRTISDYIAYLKEKNLSPVTIQAYVTQLRSFFAANQIMIFNEQFRKMVKLPKAKPKDLHAITKQEIKSLLKHSNDKWKAIISVGVTSGIRIGALLSLTPSMIKVRPKCVRITMPPEITKTHRRTEISYTTLEAYNLMRPFAKSYRNHVEPDIPFFGDPDKHINQRSSSAEWDFGVIRRSANLTEKYPGGKRYKVTFHSLRSYFFTKATQVHGDSVAQYLIGHSVYLDQYLRHDPEYVEKKYLELIPELQI